MWQIQIYQILAHRWKQCEYSLCLYLSPFRSSGLKSKVEETSQVWGKHIYSLWRWASVTGEHTSASSVSEHFSTSSMRRDSLCPITALYYAWDNITVHICIDSSVEPLFLSLETYGSKVCVSSMQFVRVSLRMLCYQHKWKMFVRSF